MFSILKAMFGFSKRNLRRLKKVEGENLKRNVNVTTDCLENNNVVINYQIVQNDQDES